MTATIKLQYQVYANNLRMGKDTDFSFAFNTNSVGK